MDCVQTCRSDQSEFVSRSITEKFWFKRPIVNNGAYIEISDERLCNSVEKALIKFLKSLIPLHWNCTHNLIKVLFSMRLRCAAMVHISL